MRIIHCAWAAALLSALAAGSCAKDTAGNGGTGTTESYNDKIDSYLAERYLWNSEYGQMTRDLTIEYAADNDNFLTRTLLGMTSNTLDKKRYTNGTGQNYYKLYSYITRKARSRAATGPKTRGVNHGVRKETEYGFGFARLGVVRFSNTGKAGFYVMAVYPGSPADRAGFRRGTIFSEIDGAEIADSESEYTPVYKRLTSPSGAASVLFKVRETGEETTLTAERLYPNPVLRAEVIEEGEHKIGYMVYNGFDAAYDDDLLDSLRKFRDAGITDLVFDLRYNGGGHVISQRCWRRASQAKNATARFSSITATTTAAWPIRRKPRSRRAIRTIGRKRSFTRISATATTTGRTSSSTPSACRTSMC